MSYTRPLALVFIMIMLIVTYPTLNSEYLSTLNSEVTIENAIIVAAPFVIWMAVIGCGVAASYDVLRRK